MATLSGKVAIVTGASKGIGAGIAKGMAAAGAAVVVNYASSKEDAQKVVAQIVAAGGRAIALQGDVGKQADVKRVFANTIEVFGKVDIVANNAGVYEFEPFEAVAEEAFHRQFNTNVLGVLLMVQEAAKHFGEQGGAIINIGSVSSHNPQPNSVVYAATKGALDTMTVALSRELGARKIRVNAIAPGATASEGLERIGLLTPEFEQQLAGMTPLGRFGKPEDIAPVAVFLASDESAWLTGERIVASGGWR